MLPEIVNSQVSQKQNICKVSSYEAEALIENCGKKNVTLSVCEGKCWSSSKLVYNAKKQEIEERFLCQTCKPTGYKMTTVGVKCLTKPAIKMIQIKSITSCKCKTLTNCFKRIV